MRSARIPMMCAFTRLAFTAVVASSLAVSGFAQPTELVELWRVGGEDDEVVFGYVRDVATDSRGMTYAADFQHSAVYVFSGSGTLVREIGRKGEGPGEFNQLWGLIIGEADTLYVWDSGRRHVTVFSPDGHDFIEQVEVRNWQHKRPKDLIGTTADALILTFEAPFRGDGRNQEPRWRDVRVVDRKRGVFLEQALLATALNSAYIVLDDKGGYTAGVMPFRGMPQYRMSLSGLVYLGTGDDSVVTVSSIDGAVQDTVRWAQDPVPVTSREVSDALKGYNRKWRNLVRERGIPKTKPAIENFVVDDRDNVWIQTSAAHGAATATCKVLNAEGEAVGSIELPVNLRLEAVRGNRAYGVMKADDGSHVLIAYAIK